MNYILFSAVSALLLILVPIIINRRFRKSWKMPKGMFVRAGLSLLVIEVFYFTLASNVLLGFPAVIDSSPIVKSLCAGLLAGLFYELGRYVVLDKLLKQVRTVREGIYFGFCWSAMETVILGIVLLVGVFGMQMLLNTPDISAQLPDATATDIEQIKTLQEDTIQVLAQNPWMAFTTVIERASLIFVDIALSLLMILGFYMGTTGFAWMAVGIRTVFVASVSLAGGINLLAAEGVFVIFALIAFLMIKRITPVFPRK